VLPDAVDGLSKVAQRLDAAEVASVTAALKGATRGQVALALPRFKAEFRADGLVSLFKTAGMALAFDPLHADFSGMTGSASGTKLNIDDIKHRATIEVTEPGTEAAAATAVVIAGRGLAPREPDAASFVVDRPFLFYVVDDASGAILFQGRITDPRQS